MHCAKFWGPTLVDTVRPFWAVATANERKLNGREALPDEVIPIKIGICAVGDATPSSFAFTRTLVKRRKRVAVPGGSNGTP